VEIDPNAWGTLCVQGSLHESVKEVMFASSIFIKLEVLPKAIYNQRTAEV
jgi:hypothetical protein